MRSWALADLDDLPWILWGGNEFAVRLRIDGVGCCLYRRWAGPGEWEYELRTGLVPDWSAPSLCTLYEDNDPLKLQAILFDAAERGTIYLTG